MPTCPACGNDTFTLQVNHPVIHKQQDTRPDGVIVFSAATAQIVWDAPGETIIHCSRCDEMQPGQAFVYQEDDEDGDALPCDSSLPSLRGAITEQPAT